MGTRDVLTGTRTATVAVLVTGALTAVLIAWFSAGWRAAHRERDALEARAIADAGQAAGEAAAAVVGRLEDLRASESQRPYFHYQNLFHDPRGASEGRSVVPSPLAGGPLDPMIALHFQIDAAGNVTAPTVNEEVPDAAGGRAEDRALLAGLAKVRTEVVTPGDPIQIAMATPLPAAPVDGTTRPRGKLRKPRPPDGQGISADGYDAVSENDDAQQVATKDGENVRPEDVVAQLDEDFAAKLAKPSTDKPYATKKPSKRAPEPKQQVLALDPDAYAQNVTSNQIFVETKQKQAVQKPSTSLPQAPAPQQAPPQQLESMPPPQVQPQEVQPPQVQEEAPPELGNDAGDGARGASGLGLGRPSASTSTTPPPRRSSGASTAHRPAPSSPPAPAPSGPVFITVAPLGWRAATIDGEPALLAVRQVTTPDGVLTQGLIVDRARVESWLGERGGAPATVVTRASGASSSPIGLGGVQWWIDVDPTGAVAAARAAGAGLERAFLGRFVPVAALAALCAILVVLLTARAERLARQRARFAAAAAHELRTPLAGIQLYGDMLVDGLGDPKRHKDYARRVAEEASRLGRVVANVLGFSQLERGSLHVRPDDGDLSAAVQSIVERAEPALTRAGATVELDAPPGLRARFDPDALARIVGNLLDNAEKYSREHEDRSILVTVRPGTEHAEIVVVDHGPGLPAALRRRRFRPFARGTGDDGPPGLGLGLALSQNLARAMGGALSWRDQEHGAAFVVTVPMTSRAAADV